MTRMAASATSKNTDYQPYDDQNHLQRHQNVAQAAIIPHGSHRSAHVHPLLHHFVRPNAAAALGRHEGRVVGRFLRIGKGLPVRWTHHSRCGGLQKTEKQVPKTGR